MPRAKHAEPCPVCFEVKDEQFFPCGHFVCSACEAEMTRRGLLACPTCRTPREGVSRAEVEQLNHSRVRGDAAESGFRVVFLSESDTNNYEDFTTQELPRQDFTNLESTDPSMARLVSVLTTPTNLRHFMALRDRVLDESLPR